MVGQRIQSDQVVLDNVKRNLGNYPRQEYDQLMDLIDDKVAYPGKVILNSVSGSDALLKVYASPLQKLKGIGQASTSGADYEAFAPIVDTFLTYGESYIDLSTGSVTGNISVPSVTTTNGYWRWMQIYAMSTSGAYGVIFGTETSGVPVYGTNMPAKVDDTQILSSIKVQNSGGGSWAFGRPTINNIMNHTRGGGAGSSSSGDNSAGGEIFDLRFYAHLEDSFNSLPNSASPVDVSTGKTPSTAYDGAYDYYRLSYDASKNVSGNGTTMNLSSAPAFTASVGDMLIFNSEAKRITALGNLNVDGTGFTIESAFTVTPSVSGACVSQTLYTKDLNGFDANGTGQAVSSQITTNVSEVLVSYTDTETLGDIIPNWGSSPVIGYSISANATSWSTVRTRQTSLNQSNATASVPVESTQFLIRFFANKSSGSGAVNILSMKASWHKQIAEQAGLTLNQAYARPTASIFQNCTHGVVGNKSRLTFPFSYPVGVNSGEAAGGSLDVYINGQNLSRFVSGYTNVSEAFYKEIDDKTIEFDQDYTGLGLEFVIKLKTTVIDSNTLNTTRLASIESYHSEISEIDRVQLPLVSVSNTTIVKRAQMTDLSSDLAVNTGFNRFSFYDLFSLPEESGANGEPVFGVAGDKFNQVRLVGGAWTRIIDTNNIYLSSGANIVSYVEYTFYGTGANIILLANSSTLNHVVSIDGGSESANIIPSSASGVLGARNYRGNQVINIASGLSLGVHTVKIRNNSASTSMALFGFEAIGNISQLSVNAGIYEAKGKAYSLALQSLSSYNSGFDSGTLGTRGGRVLVYLKPDGTVGKALTPTNTSSLTLTNTDHTNEDVIRKYAPREFGSGRADDFSTLINSDSTRAFTLEDGLTTMVLSSGAMFFQNGIESLLIADTGTLLITFIGTGFDLNLGHNDATARSYAVSIDGAASAGNITQASSEVARIAKVVSGLPYGIHTIKLTGNTGGGARGPWINSFTVYGPKKPTIPSNYVELCEYYLTADFVANTTAGVETVSTGVVRKAAAREFIYQEGTGGTQNWVFNGGVNTGRVGGFEVIDDRSGAYVQFAFWGTGFDYRFFTASGRSANIAVTLNGTSLTTGNFPTAATSAYGAGDISMNLSTGVMDAQSSSTVSGCGIIIRNLPLGFYVVRLQNNTASTFLQSEAFDVITPMHFPRLNSNHVIMNATEIGSATFSDLRKIKGDNLVKNKFYSAYGIASAPTTNSSIYVPIPEMGVKVVSDGQWFDVSWTISAFKTSGGTDNIQVLVNGLTNYCQEVTMNLGTASGPQTFSEPIYLPKGVYSFHVYWKTSAGTFTGYATSRWLHVRARGSVAA